MSPLLDRMRRVIRTLHDSIRTEDAYILWARKFILFHGERPPLEMGEPEVAAFLTHLAVERDVAASMRNQALGALLFLDKAVLDRPPSDLGPAMRAKKPERLPVVFTREEVREVPSLLDGGKWLMASLLYGSELRLIETGRATVADCLYPTR